MNTNTPLLPQLYPRPRINRLHTQRQARARNLCIFAAANEGFHRYIFDLKTTFLECCVPCLIVSNRDQLLNFLIKESLWPALHSKGQPKIGHVRSIFSWSRVIINTEQGSPSYLPNFSSLFYCIF